MNFQYFSLDYEKVIKSFNRFYEVLFSKIPFDSGLISPTCLRGAFMPADPKSAKRQSSYQSL